jgi:hypothetical protein
MRIEQAVTLVVCLSTREQNGRVAPPSALAGRPLLSACHPAETIGEDSAARLVVKAKHSV